VGCASLIVFPFPSGSLFPLQFKGCKLNELPHDDLDVLAEILLGLSRLVG